MVIYVSKSLKSLWIQLTNENLESKIFDIISTIQYDTVITQYLSYYAQHTHMYMHNIHSTQKSVYSCIFRKAEDTIFQFYLICFMEIQFIFYKILPLKGYSSVVFSTVTEFCIHLHYLIPELSSSQKESQSTSYLTVKSCKFSS